MLDWWGPIIHEYYAGSEGNGFCAIGPEEWLAHPGSVGRPLTAAVHIVNEDGDELPAGEPGQIWFESDARFEYHNDPEKTAGAFNERGWSTLGDVGYLDDDGYLFLTDRVSHMIISGGVNIYPQEIENLLAMHPSVADVAVIGVPNADLGEEVKAVVVPAPGAIGRRPARRRADRPLPRPTSRTTSARCRSTSSTNCRGCRPASCSSVSCAAVLDLTERRLYRSRTWRLR